MLKNDSGKMFKIFVFKIKSCIFMKAQHTQTHTHTCPTADYNIHWSGI